MSTKFFTNEADNTLISKIEGIFKYRNIHFFNALVGNFRASGYFRIRKFVEKADKIRILVGINIDNLIHEASQQVKRIDNSFFAFKQSLERFLLATKAIVTMFENGKIYITPNLPVSNMINEDKEEEFLNLIIEKSLEY